MEFLLVAFEHQNELFIQFGSSNPLIGNLKQGFLVGLCGKTRPGVAGRPSCTMVIRRAASIWKESQGMGATRLYRRLELASPAAASDHRR